VTISVKGTQISGNLVSGLSPTNSNQPTIKVGNSQITANARGLGAGGSSKIFSLGGNQLHSNSVDGTFSGAIATQ
jgi:hypothetical protein